MEKRIANRKLRRVLALVLVFTLAFTSMVNPGKGSAPSATTTGSYIIQGTSAEQVAQVVEAYGGKVTSRLDIIQGVAAEISQDELGQLLAEETITSIVPNAAVKSAGKGHWWKFPTTDYPDVMGADRVWEQGITGDGVTVAVVDTGVGLHPGIVQGADGRIRDRLIGWKDFVDDHKKLPRDPNGHGTHVAGIIVNSQRGEDGEWNGVAPGVNLVAVRVLDETGAGTYEQVINGIQWVVNRKDELNIRVMNLSLVSPVQSPYWADPLNQAVTKAWAAGITVVAAAGNGGPDAMTIGVPGNNPYVITAGAFTDNYTPDDWGDDYIADFSAAGPTLDAFVKPDVVAPGGHIVSTMFPNSYLAKNHDANRESGQYFSMAGTSQAAASVSGVAALMISAHPELTPDQVKYRILLSALPWVHPETSDALYSIWQQGAGRVNALDAVTMPDVGQANLGLDIQADLAGTQHYQGYTYYDETTGQFLLSGDFNGWDGDYWAWNGTLGSWSGGLGSWSGAYGSWSGGLGSWSGGLGSWSGGLGSWSGGLGSWSGSFGTWSGGLGSWSGGYGTWSGGLGSWSGGLGSWSGSLPWIDTSYADPAFYDNFMAGVGPNATSRTTFVGRWVEER